MKTRQNAMILNAMSLVALLFTSGCASYVHKIGTLPGGRVIREHAKPMEGGYYKNFDPEAVSLEVVPAEDTNPVKTQHVLIATVKDAKGNPLPSRRVEWIIEEGSVGSIVEVDESGYYDTRGEKLTNKYAISHTNRGTHVLTRGNEDPSDDIQIGKGQTWCTITSPVEGDTHVVAYAPAIYNWDHHKVFVVKHWQDAKWEWPPEATNPIGTPHALTVKVMKSSDGTPIAGWTVNFKIASGPAATFEPGGGATASVETDGNGTASVRLNQTTPVEGVNVIEMEIIRPEHCCNSPMRIATGTTTKTWVGPAISIEKTAPGTASVGEEFQYTIVVTNPGKAESTNVRVSDELPDGIQFVASSPEASPSGRMLEWSLGTLAVGENRMIAVKVKATKTGRFENCADVKADHNLSGRSCAPTVVTSPQLRLEKTGPSEVLICEPITYTVTVRNTGDAPAANVTITDKLPDGLTTANDSQTVVLNAGTLGPGESKQATYNVKASKTGIFSNTAVVTGDGGLTAEASHQIIVRQPVLVMTKKAPSESYLGRHVTYEITVTNKGDGVARDTTLVDTLPSGLEFASASDNGQFSNGNVTWSLGNLEPNATKTVTLASVAKQTGTLRNTASVRASCAEASAEATTKVIGFAAVLLEVLDVEDPIEVGKNETYVITVTNQGSAVDSNIRIVCMLPTEEEYVSSSGPTEATSSDRTVTFAPLAELAPKAATVYRVVVKGVQAGDVRFKVELTSDMLTSPVTETESTHIYGTE